MLPVLAPRSEGPDSKRQRTDDSAGGQMTSDANNQAYNYNWYQVRLPCKRPSNVVTR